MTAWEIESVYNNWLLLRRINFILVSALHWRANSIEVNTREEEDREFWSRPSDVGTLVVFCTGHGSRMCVSSDWMYLQKASACTMAKFTSSSDVKYILKGDPFILLLFLPLTKHHQGTCGETAMGYIYPPFYVFHLCPVYQRAVWNLTVWLVN